MTIKSRKTLICFIVGQIKIKIKVKGYTRFFSLLEITTTVTVVTVTTTKKGFEKGLLKDSGLLDSLTLTQFKSSCIFNTFFKGAKLRVFISKVYLEKLN